MYVCTRRSDNASNALNVTIIVYRSRVGFTGGIKKLCFYTKILFILRFWIESKHVNPLSTIYSVINTMSIFCFGFFLMNLMLRTTNSQRYGPRIIHKLNKTHSAYILRPILFKSWPFHCRARIPQNCSSCLQTPSEYHLNTYPHYIRQT